MALYRSTGSSFPFINPSKTCDPWGGAKFDLRAIIWALSIEAY